MKTLILAEDDMILRKSLSYFLRSQNYAVIECANGEEVLQASRDQDFAALITDLNLPYTGGLELIAHFRKESETYIPIIVMTSYGVESIELESLQLGADEFMTKPISPAILLNKIQKLIR